MPADDDVALGEDVEVELPIVILYCCNLLLMKCWK